MLTMLAAVMETGGTAGEHLFAWPCTNREVRLGLRQQGRQPAAHARALEDEAERGAAMSKDKRAAGVVALAGALMAIAGTGAAQGAVTCDIQATAAQPNIKAT